MKHTILGFIAGCLIAIPVWLIERTTGNIAWGLIVSFPVSWGIAGYWFRHWDAHVRKGQG